MSYPGRPSGREVATVVHLISSKAGAGGAERVVAALARGAGRRGWQAAVVNPFALDAGTGYFEELYAPAPYFQRQTRGYGAVLAARQWTASGCPSWRRAWSTFISTTRPCWQPPCVPPPVPAGCLPTTTAPFLTNRAAVPEGSWTAGPPAGSAGPSPCRQRWATTWSDGVVWPGEVTVVRNGWSGRPQPAALLASPPTVVCVANFRPEKRHDVLVKAFGEVLRAVPTARLLLAGTGPLEAEVRQDVARRGLAEAVVFCGSLTDVWPTLAEGDVFALASSYEGLGSAVVEAMAAGLPVVATAAGGLRELVRPGRSGWLVAPGDHAEMARRIIQLLTDEDARRAFGAFAALEAGAMTEAVMVDRYFDIYKILAGP